MTATKWHCPLCGANKHERLPYPSGAGKSLQLQFDEIAHCAACGIGYALPRATQESLDAFYAAGAYWHQTVTSAPPQLAHERNQCRHRVASVHKHLARGGLIAALDVGAGHGWTMDALHAALPETRLSFDFIEPDDALSREILARDMPFPVLRRLALDRLDAEYDLIFLNHVLEHVADPVVFLQAVRRRLKPGAVLYVETPHRDYRYKNDVFPHTLFFDSPSLSRSLRQAGFERVSCETFGRWPIARRNVSLFLSRLVFRAAVIAAPAAIQDCFDDWVWDYRPREDGIWLRGIARNPDDAAKSST